MRLTVTVGHAGGGHAYDCRGGITGGRRVGEEEREVR